MAVQTTLVNKPLNPRGNDQSPLAYNRAKLFSGKALDFDGVNDRLDGGSIDALGTGDFSYSVYFNPDGFSTYHGLFAIGTIYNFGLLTRQTTGEVYVYSATTGDIDSGYFLKDDEWKHITFVRSGTSHKFYIDGVLFSDITDTAFSVVAGVYKIGHVTSYFANGQYSNARLFNTALTAAQVADLYNNPEKIVPTGVDNDALKLWLPMQEGAGTTAYDGSGNGNHGAVSGASWLHGIGAPVAQTAVIDWNKSHNYIDKSEEFETTSWTENRLVTITDDSFIAPDGSATATEIVETTANDTHFLAQTLSVTAGDYFISAYVKKRDYDWIQLSTGGDTSRYANFNISTGATGTASGITDLIIQDKGNGWYRIGGKITTSATAFNYFITLIQSNVSSRFQTYTGTDKGQYIWGAQATKSSTLQPYLRNIGTSAITSDVLLPAGLTTGRDITGVNLFENVRKQGALNLDGNSWAEVHDNASFDLKHLSLECWFNADTTITGDGLLGQWASNQGYLLFASTGSNFAFYIDTQSVNYFSVLTGWNHIVGVYNGAKIQLYINGTKEAESNRTIDPTLTSAPIEIGRFGESVGTQYGSQIAQPRIYNRALTAEEVLRNYNSGKNTYKND